MSLSGCDMHLEADTKVLTTSLRCLACFIQKHPLKGCPIEQFPSVLGIDSYVWRLLQAVSETRWDCFKISPQPDAPTLIEAMRTVYGSIPVPTPSPDVKMAVNAPEAEEVAFTLATNIMRTFCTCCSLRKHFPIFFRLLSFPCTRPA